MKLIGDGKMHRSLIWEAIESGGGGWVKRCSSWHMLPVSLLVSDEIYKRKHDHSFSNSCQIMWHCSSWCSPPHSLEAAGFFLTLLKKYLNSNLLLWVKFITISLSNTGFFLFRFLLPRARAVRCFCHCFVLSGGISSRKAFFSENRYLNRE